MVLDILAIGAHPDDVELGCGGTLAQAAQAGKRVGILHLTRGEASTRGSVEERRVEAENAAEALGAATLDWLDLGDGILRHGPGEEDVLIALLRRHRPELVLGPTPSDRHPDHGKAHALVGAACFYSGLAKRGSGGAPHRPAAVFSYMQHDPFDVAFIVDVTAGWEKKLAALAAYRTQIHQPGIPAEGPVTKVSTEDFRHAMEGRARHYGLMISATFGEPFASRLPLAVRDPLQLLPQGVR